MHVTAAVSMVAPGWVSWEMVLIGAQGMLLSLLPTT